MSTFCFLFTGLIIVEVVNYNIIYFNFMNKVFDKIDTYAFYQDHDLYVQFPYLIIYLEKYESIP